VERVEPLGDGAVLVVLGEGIDPALNARVHHLAALLRERVPGLLDLVPAYATLAVHYDPGQWSAGGDPCAALAARIGELWAGAALARPAPRVVEIPVCYGGDHGPDLWEVVRHCGLPEAEIIARHTAAPCQVFMLGFAPGFAYLGGLDPALATPRRPTPRPRVPAGSVGIGGLQTGIYALDGPGGWRIIGRTPVRMFDPGLPDDGRTPLPMSDSGCAEPCRLRPGDQVRFVAIDEARYQFHSQDRP
jgi:KipI family sensor histidine kinase inhibitor